MEDFTAAPEETVEKPLIDPETPEVPLEEPKVEPEVKVEEAPKEFNWRDAVPDEYKEHLKDVKDLGSLAKQYVDQQSFLGNSIRVPGEDASEDARREFQEKIIKHAPDLMFRPSEDDPESHKAFMRSIGVPEKAEDYKLDIPEGIDKSYEERVREYGSRYGITNKALQQFVNDEQQRLQVIQQVQNEAQEKDIAALKEEWGDATPGKIENIKKLAKQAGFPDSFMSALENGKVASFWLKPMDKLVQAFGSVSEGQEGFFQGDKVGHDTPAELEAKIMEIEGNPVFRTPSDPRHKVLVAKRMVYIEKLKK